MGKVELTKHTPRCKDAALKTVARISKLSQGRNHASYQDLLLYHITMADYPAYTPDQVSDICDRTMSMIRQSDFEAFLVEEGRHDKN